MEFYVYETGETVKAQRRPAVMITSNNESGACRMRSCAAASSTISASPIPTQMRAIVEGAFPRHQARSAPVAEALRLLYEIRDAPGLKKKLPDVGACSTG